MGDPDQGALSGCRPDAIPNHPPGLSRDLDDLPDHRLEVYRDPAEDSYRSVTRHPAGDRIAPLARPSREILVDDLLP